MNMIKNIQYPEDLSHKGLMFEPYKCFGKNGQIFRQGNKASNLYLIKSGKVKISRISESGDEWTQEIITEGEIFGEWSSLVNSHKVHRCTATALCNQVSIYKLNIEHLSEQQRSSLLLELTPVILRQKDRAEKRHELLLKADAAYRIKETLLDLGFRGGEKFGEETLLKISISHEDISRLADTSRQSVTKVMNELKIQGKIYYTRDRILFRNLTHIHH
jgi:CRP-like cAMP-binding protein